MIIAFCFTVEVFISKIGIKISCSRTSISFYNTKLVDRGKMRMA